MSARRVVRVAQQFFDRLDELFPAVRSDEGVPSATDFLLHELPTVIDRLAEDYVGATVSASGDDEVRAFVSAGTLVAYFAVYAALERDGSVEIFYLEVDRLGLAE